MAPWAMPTARAAMIGRLVLKASITRLNPVPSWGPRRFSSGTNASSRNSGHDGMPRAPSLSSLRPIVSPRVPRSTMKRFTFSRPLTPVHLAPTRMKSAMLALVHQIFACQAGKKAALLLVSAGSQQRPEGNPLDHEQITGVVTDSPKLLDGNAGCQHVARAAVLHRKRQRE